MRNKNFPEAINSDNSHSELNCNMVLWNVTTHGLACRQFVSRVSFLRFPKALSGPRRGNRRSILIILPSFHNASLNGTSINKQSTYYSGFTFYCWLFHDANDAIKTRLFNIAIRDEAKAQSSALPGPSNRFFNVLEDRQQILKLISQSTRLNRREIRVHTRLSR